MNNLYWYYNQQPNDRQSIWEYQHEQSEEVAKALKAFRDLRESCSKLDFAHAQELGMYCLFILAWFHPGQ